MFKTVIFYIILKLAIKGKSLSIMTIIKWLIITIKKKKIVILFVLFKCKKN